VSSIVRCGALLVEQVGPALTSGEVVMPKGLMRKVMLAAILFLVLIALVAAFVLLSVNAMQEASALLSAEVVPQLDAKGDFNTSMAHVLGELEVFVFSHDRADLDEAQGAVLEAQDALSRLGTEATDADESVDPADVAATQRLLERATALLETAQHLLADATTPNAVLGPETVAAIEEAHTELEELEGESDTTLERQRTNVAGVLATSVLSVFVGAAALAAVCVGLVLLGLFLLRRVIVHPVIALAGAAQDVASGNLRQSVAVTGSDEIGTLQRSFTTMVATLGQQRDQLQQQVETANTALATAEAARTEIAAQLETIEQQRTVIREMSVPILPLSERAFVIPLIGTLDTGRLQIAQQRALHAMERSTTAYVVMDVTGVPLIDSQVARGLLDIIKAARLLGTQVVLVGIRPEVAQTLVQLGIELDQVAIRGTLQDGITYVLQQG
jgi:rsbT co-antagonist protein RsbR